MEIQMLLNLKALLEDYEKMQKVIFLKIILGEILEF